MTMAKRQREQAVEERRTRKREAKQAAAAARKAGTDGTTPSDADENPTPASGDEPALEGEPGQSS